MIKSLITFIFIGIFSSLLSQDSVIDSLKRTLKNTKNDLKKCEILVKLAELTDDNEWPMFNRQLYKISNENLAKSTENTNEFQRYFVKSINNEAYLCYFKGEYEKSKKLLNSAISISLKTNDISSQAESYNHFAFLYKNEGNIKKALDYYSKSRSIEEKLNKFEDLSYTLNNIGAIHYDLGDLNKAIDYFSKCREIQLQIGDSIGYANSLINTGTLYLNLKKYDLASKDFDLAKSILSKHNNVKGLAKVYNYFGNLYAEQKKWANSENYYNKSLKIYNNSNNKNGIATIYKNLATIQIKQKKWYEAKENTFKSLKISKLIKKTDLTKENYYNLYLIYKNENEFKKSAQYLENYHLLKDSLYSEETKRKALQSHLQYDFDKKHLTDSISFAKEKENAIIDERNKQKIQLLEYENLQKQNKVNSIILASTIGFLLILSVFIYLLFKRFKKEKNLTLELEESVKERDLLNKEIHHRVKNNLQIISSLLNMQKDNLEDKELINALQQSQNRIQAMALIHEKLYQSGNLKDVKLSEYFENLLNYFAETYQFELKNIQYKIDLPAIFINADKLIPLGLIANEIVLNSVKYAFNDRENGKIKIMGNVVNSKIFIIFEDDGVGLPENWQEKSKNSLGMNLINGISRQLKGTSTIESVNGTKISLSFDL
jgi:two-component system, sensor histidine kinase PdtaS